MSKLGEFGGVFEVVIDGKTLEVKPKKKDKWTIMKLSQKAKSMEVDDFEKLDEVLERILVESYPESTGEERESFLIKHSETMLSELSIAFGWTTREKMNALLDEELKKNREELGQEAKKTSEDSY